MPCVQQSSRLGKYRDLVIAIGLFLVLDLGVLIFNFYSSERLEQNAVQINTAGELRMLTQQITRALLTMRSEQQSDLPIQTSMAQLTSGHSKFNEAFNRPVDKMSPRELKSDDIEVFSESVAAFFEMTTHDKAPVRSAYLLDSDEPVVWNEYNGVINISGAFQGSVCFSSPRGLLTHVLLRLGESNYSDAFHRDIVGEIANTMSGRARKHFGENMEISPPRAFPGKTENIARTAKSSPYVIPFKWNGYEAHLVVNMDVVV